MTAPLPRRRISRELTRIANAPVGEVLDAIGDGTATLAHRIGVTGPPGGGKSTLISALAARRIAGGLAETIAVLAIDPSSPVSGGAILGDRVRMDAIADLPGLFIRSLSSRGAQNGLCDNVIDLLTALEGHGFGEIVLETVGVGQSEVAVHGVVDTLVVIVPPDAGDSVQTMKSGLLEVADILVVTKAEQPAARRMASEIESVRASRDGWLPPVLRTAMDGTGVAELSAAIEAHRDWLPRGRSEAVSRDMRRRYHLRAMVDRQVQEVLSDDAAIASGTLAASYRRLLAALRAP